MVGAASIVLPQDFLVMPPAVDRQNNILELVAKLEKDASIKGSSSRYTYYTKVGTCNKHLRNMTDVGTLQLVTQNPKPETLNPKLYTLNPKP
jgi:hypothetical protein